MSAAETAEVIDTGAAAGGAGAAGRLLGSELRLIFTRRRNIAGMAVLAAVPILLAVTTKVWGGGSGPDFVASITASGLFVALAALAIELPLFLPLAVATIAGDSIAGEANQGTLRYLLTVPVGRTRLLLIKYASIVIFALAATALVAVVGVLIGVILFGAGPMITFSGTSQSFAVGSGRLVLIVGYLAAGFAALGAIGLFVSVLTEQPIGATVATVLINVVMFVLDTIPQLDWLHPWLLTHWWTAFGDLLRDPMAFEAVGRGLLTAAGYALVFWLAAWARFAGKDVSS